ncbi:hypothetical protein OIDMADRAFT_28647 [Oidiodendron maius Zn]|uniref:Uncharacterized protein n=1 Tax=Oidiodendron maius (strain Zn) TaxID=913774 RepID=A0A0C3HCK7_OIDMZ|nr:hypothetical protein OIDMADRAFT_28647 [Oidiodendron maius Zn]
MRRRTEEIAHKRETGRRAEKKPRGQPRESRAKRKESTLFHIIPYFLCKINTACAPVPLPSSPARAEQYAIPVVAAAVGWWAVKWKRLSPLWLVRRLVATSSPPSDNIPQRKFQLDLCQTALRCLRCAQSFDRHPRDEDTREILGLLAQECVAVSQTLWL